MSATQAAGGGRVFFALWPDEPLAHALHALGAGHAGRRTLREDLHITLAFIGEADAEGVAALRRLAARTPLPACALEIDRLGYWPHNRILWAGPTALPQALTDFVDRLHAGLREAGFRLDERPWAPHVTLLRDAKAFEGAAMPPLHWQVTAWRLAVSQAGARGDPRYGSVEEWSAV